MKFCEDGNPTLVLGLSTYDHPSIDTLGFATLIAGAGGTREMPSTSTRFAAASRPLLNRIIGLPIVWAAALGTAGLGAVAFAQAERPGPAHSPSPRTQPSPAVAPLAADAPMARTSTVTLKEGRLSVRVENRSQDWVLEEISRQAKVAMTRVSGSGSRRLSVRFEDLSLDDGLRRILADDDAFFFYGAQGRAPASLRAVWIYAKGKGKGLEPVPPEAWASSRDLERDLADADAAVRARAIEALIERKRDGARDAVLEALKDPDEAVRTGALYESLSNDVELSTDLLGDLALDDSSPDVRFLALDALADHPDVRAIAERAASDPSPHVRHKAQEILQALEKASRPDPPSPRLQGRSPRPDGR